MVDDVLSDNYRWGVMHELEQCYGTTSKSGVPTIQASSCSAYPSNVLKLRGTTLSLPRGSHL